MKALSEQAPLGSGIANEVNPIAIRRRGKPEKSSTVGSRGTSCSVDEAGFPSGARTNGLPGPRTRWAGRININLIRHVMPCDDNDKENTNRYLKSSRVVFNHKIKPSNIKPGINDIGTSTTVLNVNARPAYISKRAL